MFRIVRREDCFLFFLVLFPFWLSKHSRFGGLLNFCRELVDTSESITEQSWFSKSRVSSLMNHFRVSLGHCSLWVTFLLIIHSLPKIVPHKLAHFFSGLRSSARAGSSPSLFDESALAKSPMHIEKTPISKSSLLECLRVHDANLYERIDLWLLR
jgi:hypothetical protein